jgi:predicted ribosomally synthesized peptide with SipW-like signal peptide
MSSKHARLGRFLASARTRAALSLGVVLSVGVTGTFALWSDSSTVTGTTFTAGTVKLNLKDGTGANPFQHDLSGYASLNLATMVPGNSTAAVITVKNAGTAPLTFVASSSATNADGLNLAGALVVKVTADNATGGSGLVLTCPGSAIASSGTSLNGSLLTTPIALSATSTTTVCVQVSLPSNANTLLQGATSNATLTFTGTQN